jgi:peptide/nickel transport system substrate-binding protein
MWFLVAAAATVLVVVSSGAATGSASANRVLTAAPFNTKYLHMTPAQRAASGTLNLAAEQQIAGFNTLNYNTDQLWAVIVGDTPVIRGNYIIDQNGDYHLDLASAVTATKSSLTIDIRKDAYWYWKGHAKMPVTSADYVYTYKQIMDSHNDVGSTTGYSNITGYKIVSPKEVIFYWNPAFADYKDLFGLILPSKALQGESFNSYWTNCICGNDKKPISDGPYYLSNYSYNSGDGTLKINPDWYGSKPNLNTINFIFYADQTSEEQAYNDHEVDAMYPGAATSLAQYINQNGTTYSSIKSYGQEHFDFGEDTAAGANPLLSNTWMRQAISEGTDRQAIINTVFTGIAKGLSPLNNPVFEPVGSDTPFATGKYSYDKPYNYNPKGAIALLSKHCSGGPSKPSSSNNKYWSCGGKTAEFTFSTTTRQARQTTAGIVQAELKSIGIKINQDIESAGQLFGTTLPSFNFDIAEYAWSGGPDPSGFDAIYQCFNAKKNLGGGNYKRFCDPAVDKDINEGDSDLGSRASRFAHYEAEAKAVADQAAVLPLYGTPSILIYRDTYNLKNANNPTSTGPTWNIEKWTKK